MSDELHPVIRALLIELIDQTLQRPLSNILFEKEQKEPFDSLKKKLESKESLSLDDFHLPIQLFFSKSKKNTSKYVSGAAIVLEDFFEKKYNFISLLANYRFKDAFAAAAKKAFPDVEIVPQDSEDGDFKDEIESETSPNKTKKTPSGKIDPQIKVQEQITKKEDLEEPGNED